MEVPGIEVLREKNNKSKSVILKINSENNEKAVSRPAVAVPGTIYSIVEFSFIKFIHKILSIIISQVPG